MTQEIQPTNPGKRSNPFDVVRKQDPHGQEFWSSRDLANILGYTDYRNFKNVIDKAKQACTNSGGDVKEHFVDINEMIDIGNNAKRPIEYTALSRYACYLVAQNADPAKEIVAQAQTYFAIQTRRQELGDQERENMMRLTLRDELKKHNRQLADAAKGAGVIDPRDYAIFQNYGYKGLYNGLTKSDIQARKGLTEKENILDHMGSTELAANLFRATQAEERIRKEKIVGKSNANMAHFDVGQKVRKAIDDIGGTMPEDLPPAENIKKILPSKKKKSLDKH